MPRGTERSVRRASRRSPGSPSARAEGEPVFFVVGKVLRPHGVRGEVRVALDTDHPEHLAPPLTVYLGAGRIPYPIEGARLDRGHALLKLAGFEGREQADALRGQEVAIRADEAVPPLPGEFYVHQVIGLQVWTENGAHLGKVVEILETGANDVYVVRGPTGEVLVPAIRDVVLGIDPAAGRIVIRPLEGML